MTSANHAIWFELRITLLQTTMTNIYVRKVKIWLDRQSQRGSWYHIGEKPAKKQLRPKATNPQKTWKVHSWSAITKEVLRNVITSINEIGSWIVCCNITRISFSDFGMTTTSDVTKSITRFSLRQQNMRYPPVQNCNDDKLVWAMKWENKTFQFGLLAVAYCMENTE